MSKWETALYRLTVQIQAAWRAGGVTSVLALDLSGAFDTVDHKQLLYTMAKMGFPKWVTVRLQSFLTDLSTKLLFDGDLSETIPTASGVPQGSPLSPIYLSSTPLSYT